MKKEREREYKEISLYLPATLVNRVEKLSERINLFIDEIVINALMHYLGFWKKEGEGEKRVE